MERRSRAWPSLRILAAGLCGLATVAALVLAVLFMPRPRQAPSVLAFAFPDGRIEWVTSAGQDVRVLPSEALYHPYADPRTQLAVDTRTQRLWYSDTHTAVKSVDLQNTELVDTLTGFADTALVGCATVSDGRPVAVDSARRRLFVPVATGGVLIYDVDTLRLRDAISAGSLETEPGLLPALAVDQRSGALWYGARNGDLLELHEGSFRPSGRRISYASDAHVLRSLAVVDGRLVALAGDGTMRVFGLRDGIEVEPPVDWLREQAVGLGGG